DRDVERAFVPLFHELLDSFTHQQFDPDRFARVLSALRAHFEVWDYAATWRSRAVWEAFRERAVSSNQVLGDGGLIAATWSLPDPAGPDAQAATVGETTEALRFLYRALSPVTAELPVADVTHATSSGMAAIPGILAAVERRTAMIVSEPTLYLRDQYLTLSRHGLPFPLKRLLLRFSSAMAQTAYHFADRVAPACEWGGRWEQAYGVPPDRIEVIYPGVDQDAFRPMPMDRSERPTVVSLSPMEPREDLETLLDVADRVRRAVPDVLFMHHGPAVDGPYSERIRALARDRLLEDTVKFMGPTDRVAAALASADLMVSTTTSETFPLAVVESLACGTPVVATAVGGVHEALEGPGLTAPPGDAERLAEAVVAILRLPDEQRQLLAEAARSIATQKFGLSTFVERYREAYVELWGVPVEAVPAARKEEVPMGVAVAKREIEVQAEAEAEVPAAASPVPAAAPRVPAAAPRVPAAAFVRTPAAAAAAIPPAPPMPRERRAEPAPSVAPPTPARRLVPAAAATPGRRPLLWEVPAPAPAGAAAFSGPLRAGSADRAVTPTPTPTPSRPAPTPARPNTPSVRKLSTSRPPAEPTAAPAAPPRLVPVPNGMAPSELGLALESEDPFARVGALSRAGGEPGLADVVATALADDYPQVRREAVRALQRIGGPLAGRALADAVA
ncbi:MAG TPA: glycosyltransferase, partial [Actinomycetota bacterium]|nr:glycosyltransferase [Actinomycetota bacterium]